jgi:hypothetical protein
MAKEKNTAPSLDHLHEEFENGNIYDIDEIFDAGTTSEEAWVTFKTINVLKDDYVNAGSKTTSGLKKSLKQFFINVFVKSLSTQSGAEFKDENGEDVSSARTWFSGVYDKLSTDSTITHDVVRLNKLGRARTYFNKVLKELRENGWAENTPFPQRDITQFTRVINNYTFPGWED